MPFDDEDEEKDSILKQLSGEVDDYAGKQLPEEKAGGPITGVSIEIKPLTGGGKENPASEEDVEQEGIEGEEGKGEDIDGKSDDMIAHVLGMCGGGCAYCKGGKV